MKSISRVLLVTLPLVLSQDYVVPTLDYDTTTPTCDNVNRLIAVTTSDVSRLTHYVSVTLPERSKKLNDIYGSVKKTCQIVQTKPSLVQTSSKLRTENIKTLEKLSHQVNHIAKSVDFNQNIKASRSLVQLKSNAVEASDLCGNVFDTIINLKSYLKFLIPAIKDKYINGVLAERLNTLESFNAECLSAACNTDKTGNSDNSDNEESSVQVGNNGNDDTNTGAENTNTGAAETLTAEQEYKALLAGYKDGDYYFYPTFDTNGNDLLQLQGFNVPQLKEWCNANSACIGFNTDGWVKFALNPKDQWSQFTSDKTQGFYSKIEAPDVAVASGDANAGYDDITTGTDNTNAGQDGTNTGADDTNLGADDTNTGVADPSASN